MDDTTEMSAAELLELNRDIQGSPTIRLLATLNLGVYATLMDHRHRRLHQRHRLAAQADRAARGQ